MSVSQYIEDYEEICNSHHLQDTIPRDMFIIKLLIVGFVGVIGFIGFSTVNVMYNNIV